MKPFVFVTAAVLFLSSFAGAEPVIRKDWMTDRGPDEVFAKDSCLAATNVSVGTHRSQLLLSFTADKLSVPQLLLKVWDNPAPDAQLLIKVSSKVSYPLFLWKASTRPDEPSVYWYAPIGWSPLADYIAAANSLSVQGATTQLQISLKGSSASLDDVEKCLNSKEILPLDFLKKLNAKTERVEAPFASIDDTIQGIEVSFAAYRDGMAKTKELTTLRKGAAKLLGQEADALEVYNSALKRLQTATDELNKQNAQKAALEQTLSQTNANLQRQQADLVVAQDVLKQKTAIYEPVYQQFVVFVRDAEAKQDALDRNRRTIRHAEARISEIQREIPRLRDEQDRLRNKIADLQIDIDRARREYDEADRRAMFFDVERETREALNSDFFYRNAVQRLEQARRDGQRFAQEARQARNDQRVAEGVLASCRATPGQDCTAQENQVNELRRRADEAERNVRQAEMEIRNQQMNVERIEDSVRQSKQQEKNRLLAERDNAARKYRGLEAEQDAARARRNAIDLEIPRLQSELSSTQNQLASARAQTAGLEQALNEAIQQREAARIRLDFDRINQEYQVAKEQVASLQSAVSRSKQIIADTEKALARIKPVIEAALKEVALRTDRRDQAALKLAPIQEALKPFRAQEAVLTQAISTLAETFELNKTRYQKTYEGWVTPAVQTMTTIGNF